MDYMYAILRLGPTLRLENLGNSVCVRNSVRSLIKCMFLRSHHRVLENQPKVFRGVGVFSRLALSCQYYETPQMI